MSIEAPKLETEEKETGEKDKKKKKKQKKPHKMEDAELLDEIKDLEEKIKKNQKELQDQIEQRRRELPEAKRKRAEELEQQIKIKRAEKKHKEKKGLIEKTEMQKDRVREAFARMSPKEFAEFMPKRFLFGKRFWIGKYFGEYDFMRFATGEQYMAVMESERFSDDEKERITKARFKFCFDWLKTPEMRKYFEEKDKYERAYGEWVEKLKDNPEEPMPEILKKKPKMDTGSALGKEVKELLRNNIKNIKEMALINRYIPDIFNRFEFVGHIQFGMIQKIREHEAFAGRGRHIRKVKFADFYDIINHVKEAGIVKGQSEEYFNVFTTAQLKVLRDRMREAFRGKGGRGKEVAGGGSDIHQFPLVMDLMDRTTLRGFADNDDEEKHAIIKHMLIAEMKGKISEENTKALLWLISAKEGLDFYLITHVTTELGIDIKELAERLGVDKVHPDLKDKTHTPDV